MRSWLICIALVLQWTCCISQEITCEPPNIAHGSVRNSKTIYRDGERIQISCNDGYKPADREDATCTRAGWNTTVECIALVCRQPQIDNGNIRPKQLLYQYQDSIDTSCEEGYRNTDTSFCTARGWQPPPACIRKHCEYPRLQNGKVYEWQYYFPKRPGSTLYFACNYGFLPENKNTEYWHLSYCTTRGWQPEPKCFKQCDPPRRIPNGFLNYYQRPLIEGNVISYGCNRGYSPANQQTTTTCTKNGWFPTPSCVAQDVTCGEPPVIANGDIVVNRDNIVVNRENIYLPGQELQYKCHKDFEISGRDTIRCENQAWSEPPTCEDVSCPPPPDILHGRLRGNRKSKYSPNESVQYQCDNGYYMSGSRIVKCLKKQWSQAPQCRVNTGKCGHPPSIENGDFIELVKQEYKSGDWVTYKCQRFYNMKGDAVVRCQNGRWSDTPECIVPCTASEEVMERNNIRLRWSRAEKIYSGDGDTTEFICKWGYRPVVPLSQFRVQCVNGTFRYPRCE